MRALCKRPRGCVLSSLGSALFALCVQLTSPDAAASSPEPAPAEPAEPSAGYDPAVDVEEGDCGGTPATADAAAADVPVPPSTAAEALGRQPARVKCLDESLIDEFGRARARKGVQPRTFRKAPRLSLTFSGGGYGGDLVSTNWQAGGRVGFWFTEDFGIDGQFILTPIDFRLERAATGFTGEDRYPDSGPDRLAYVFHGHLLWAPIHTKLRTGRDRVIHGDFVFYGGAGRTLHDTVQGASFDVGAAFLIFPARFFSLRLDLQDHIIGQEVLGSTRISNNLVVSASMEFWIPFHGRKAEQRRAERRRQKQQRRDGAGAGGEP